MDWVFYVLIITSALVVFCVLIGIVFVLLFRAYHFVSIHFFLGKVWNPVRNQFGGLSSIVGTLETSAIGTIISLPISFGVAIFLSELSPKKYQNIFGAIVELLAGIPSVIYGMWALFSLVPLMTTLQAHISWIKIFSGPPIGMGVFTASVVLAIMMIPFSASVMRDSFLTVPNDVKEAAYGIGATRWEVIRHIIIPTTWTGIVGSVMLALGRGLGETMAVTFVIGNSHILHLGLFYPSNTISSTLANEFIESSNTEHIHALMALSFALFIVTFIIVACSRWLVRCLEKSHARQ